MTPDHTACADVPLSTTGAAATAENGPHVKSAKNKPAQNRDADLQSHQRSRTGCREKVAGMVFALSANDSFHLG